MTARDTKIFTSWFREIFPVHPGVTPDSGETRHGIGNLPGRFMQGLTTLDPGGDRAPHAFPLCVH